MEPHLSVVVTTRNDDHGGDPLKRLQAFVNTFAAQCRRTGLSAEIIVVEWNPPADRPRVGELLRMPPDAPFPVHFVEVPPEVHQTLRYANVLPLFQMIAKNVGVRRARGRFILATNIDVIFSTELVAQLASGQLEPGRIYRVDRRDIESDFPVEASLEEQMVYCQTHQIRLHTGSGTHAVDPAGRMRPLDSDVFGSTGFTLGDGWHVREGDSTSGFFRWVSREVRFAIDRTAAPNLARGAALDLETETNPFQPDSWVYLEILDGDRLLARRRVSGRMRFRLKLDDSTSFHEIVMRELDSSGGREWLPLLQNRDRLSYRVLHIGLQTIPQYPYDIALWRRAWDSAKLVVRHTKSGVEIASDPGKYSYCARYGPFEAPADGNYEFLLEYVPVEGHFEFSVLDDERDCWLRSTPADIDCGDTRQFSLSVELQRGVKFSLFVSNHRPDGDGVSRCILRRLNGSVPQEELKCEDVETRRRSDRRSFSTITRSLVLLPFRRLKSAASSIEQRRAHSFHQTIIEDSERVRDLEARLASLAPLADLAALVRLLRENRPAELHQNACGDFQLMAREHWFDLRGYPEFEMFSMSIDGVFEAVACAAGIREQVFEMPLCIYHLEHEKGSGWTPEGEAQLRKRIEESGITWLDAGAVHIWTTYMQWLRRPMIFNGPDWGFGDRVLPEKTLQPVVNNV